MAVLAPRHLLCGTGLLDFLAQCLLHAGQQRQPHIHVVMRQKYGHLHMPCITAQTTPAQDGTPQQHMAQGSTCKSSHASESLLQLDLPGCQPPPIRSPLATQHWTNIPQHAQAKSNIAFQCILRTCWMPCQTRPARAEQDDAVMVVALDSHPVPTTSVHAFSSHNLSKLSLFSNA